MLPVKLKGVGYLRISDNKQTDNHSEEIQKKMILEKAKQEGIEIVKWRFDKAESAYRKNASKRENLRLLLNDAKQMDAIIFYDESRLTRKIFDFYQEIYCPIKDRYPHVKFYSTQSNGEWDPNDPIVQAKFVFAAEESVIKSKRAKDAQYSLLSNNNSDQPIRPGARTPVGYDVVDGVLVPNIEVPIVSLIFDLASWGHSNGKIAMYLNDNKVKSKFISKWHSSTIDYIVKNYVYAGHLSWNVKQANQSFSVINAGEYELFKNVHEAIISPIMFAIVTQVKGYKKKYGKLDSPFLLRNLVYCSCCNSVLNTKDNSPKGKSQQYLVYRCPNCKENIRAIDIHNEVLTDLTKKWTSNLHQMIEESKAALSDWLKSLKTWKKSVEQTEERILFNERMLKQQEKPEDFTSIFNDSKEIIKTEKQKLNQAIEKVHLLNNDKALFEVYSHFKNAEINSLFNTELRTLCLTFIDKIKVNFQDHNDFSLSIKYRLNPFVELENSTDQITEELLSQLPKKPKN